MIVVKISRSSSIKVLICRAQLHLSTDAWQAHPMWQGIFLLPQEQFLLQLFLQPHDIFCVICGGHGGFVDRIGTSLSFSTTHPKSSGFMLGLAMWADLSNATANDARFTCCSKAFSVGGRSFRSVDLLFRNLLTFSVAILQPSKFSDLLEYVSTKKLF